MSTHAYIIIKEKNGQMRGIYLHNDGDPACAGETLLKHYFATEKVKSLIALGGLSVLDENIGEKISFDDWKTRFRNRQCLAYIRDREEPWEYNSPDVFTEADLPGCYYSYIYHEDDETWYMYDDALEREVPLYDVVNRE